MHTCVIICIYIYIYIHICMQICMSFRSVCRSTRALRRAHGWTLARSNLSAGAHAGSANPSHPGPSAALKADASLTWSLNVNSGSYCFPDYLHLETLVVYCMWGCTCFGCFRSFGYFSRFYHGTAARFGLGLGCRAWGAMLLRNEFSQRL